MDQSETLPRSPDPHPRPGAREAVIDAAWQLSKHLGAQALNAEDISEAAGVSRASPTWLFGTISGILAAIATRGWGQLHDAVREAALAAESDRSRLQSIAEAWIEYVLANPGIYRIMTGPEVNAPLALSRTQWRKMHKSERAFTRVSERLEELQTMKHAAFTFLVDVVIEAQRRNQLRRGAPDTFARAVAAMLNGLSHDYIDEHLGRRSIKVRLQEAREMIDILLKGMKS